MEEMPHEELLNWAMYFRKRPIGYREDQRTFMWGSNDRKLMNVPFDEHPYSALAAWFKTDEGMEIYSNIEKRLNS